MKRIIILVSALLLSTTAAAQNDRTGMWEFGLIVNDQSSESLNGNQGSAIAVDGDTGWGLNFAYNFDNRFALGADFIWSSPKYTAALVPDDGVGIPETKIIIRFINSFP